MQLLVAHIKFTKSGDPLSRGCTQEHLLVRGQCICQQRASSVCMPLTDLAPVTKAVLLFWCCCPSVVLPQLRNLYTAPYKEYLYPMPRKRVVVGERRGEGGLPWIAHKAQIDGVRERGDGRHGGGGALSIGVRMTVVQGLLFCCLLLQANKTLNGKEYIGAFGKEGGGGGERCRCPMSSTVEVWHGICPRDRRQQGYSAAGSGVSQLARSMYPPGSPAGSRLL